VLAIGTERTYIAWRIVDQAMAYHFILSLETFAAFTSRTSFHRTVMWSVLRVDVCMGAESVLVHTTLRRII